MFVQSNACKLQLQQNKINHFTNEKRPGNFSVGGSYDICMPCYTYIYIYIFFYFLTANTEQGSNDMLPEDHLWCLATSQLHVDTVCVVKYKATQILSGLRKTFELDPPDSVLFRAEWMKLQVYMYMHSTL